MIRVFKISAFLFGLFSILEAFKYKIGGFSIYLGDIFYYMFALIVIINVFVLRSASGHKILVRNNYAKIWIIFIILIIGSLNIWSPIIDSSCLFYGPNGVEIAIKYAVKTIIMFCVFILILLLPTKYKLYSVKYYAYGFITAVYIHCIYSLIQMIFWYFFNEDIHTLFLSFFGVTEESVNHVLVNFLIMPVIRPSGIHWDPAYFGLWGEIIILWLFYSKLNIKSIYKNLFRLFCGLFLIVWFLSFSRTGYFALIMTLITLSILSYFNYSIRRVKLKPILTGIIGLSGILLLVVVALPEDLKEDLSKGIEYRFSHNKNDEGTNRHLMYPLYVVEGAFHDPYHLLLGYGARNSSRAIYFSGNIPEWVDREDAFDIESDFFKTIGNYGIIYFSIFLIFNYNIIIKYIKEKEFNHNNISIFYLITIISVLYAGIFYVYNDSKWVWFIYFFALIDITYGRNNRMPIKQN